MNEAVDNHLQRSIFWAETGNDISVNCELVAIRPFIPFLVKSNISGLSPFRGFGDFLGGRNRYDYHAKYHKSCLKAYFKGDPELVCVFLSAYTYAQFNRHYNQCNHSNHAAQLDKPVVRDTLESYIGFLHHENVNPVPSKSLRKETGLAQLFQMRPESAMDIFCLYRYFISMLLFRFDFLIAVFTAIVAFKPRRNRWKCLVKSYPFRCTQKSTTTTAYPSLKRKTEHDNGLSFQSV